METINIREQEEFIKLGQLLKAANLVSSGVEAKIMITEGYVCVNGEVELRRGRKLYDGDIVTFQEQSVLVKQ